MDEQQRRKVLLYPDSDTSHSLQHTLSLSIFLSISLSLAFHECGRNFYRLPR